MRDLPLSAYATPGMVGLGDAGVVPASDAEFGGLQIVYTARTSAVAKVRPFTFGHVTTELKGKKSYRGGFLLVRMMHVVGKPDIVAIVGYWILDKQDLARYYDGRACRAKLSQILAGDPASRKVLNSIDPDTCILDLNWREVAGFAVFEPSIIVHRDKAELGDDRDALKLGAVLRRHPWKQSGWLRIESIADLAGEAWEMPDLLGLFLDAEHTSVTKITPLAPSGLMPSTPSFDAIAFDVAMIKGMHVPIGAKPGRLMHSAEYDEGDGELKYGVLLGRPASGKVLLRELLTREQVQHTEANLHRGWALDEHELVLGCDEIEVPVECFLRPILVVPTQAYVTYEVDLGDAVRSASLMLTAQADLDAIREPASDLTIREDYYNYMQATNPAAQLAMYKMVRNETRLQVVLEQQENLANSCVTIRGVDHGRVLLLKAGRAAEWVGDRQSTYVHEFTDAEEVGELWPRLPNGWVVPEKPLDKAGRKRARPARSRGYMLVETWQDQNGKGSNKLMYCMETKELKLFFAVGFYNENLTFVDGAPPPPCEDPSLEYDIVERAWVNRLDPETEKWTEARARARFGAS